MDNVVRQELALAAGGLAVMLGRLDVIRLRVAGAAIGGADPGRADGAMALLDEARRCLGEASREVAGLLGPEGQAEVVTAAIDRELGVQDAA